MDALLEEGLSAPKKRRLDEKYAGDSDHASDGETSVQPMMTKIKTVLKSKWVRKSCQCAGPWEGSLSSARVDSCHGRGIGVCVLRGEQQGTGRAAQGLTWRGCAQHGAEGTVQGCWGGTVRNGP